MKYGKRKQKYLDRIFFNSLMKGLDDIDLWWPGWSPTEFVYPAPEGGVPWNPENTQ